MCIINIAAKIFQSLKNKSLNYQVCYVAVPNDDHRLVETFGFRIFKFCFELFESFTIYMYYASLRETLLFLYPCVENMDLLDLKFKFY